MKSCRVVDTRAVNGAFGSPDLVPGTRNFAILNGSCEIPSTATAYLLNVTAVPTGRIGFLTVFPAGQPQPGTSTLNSEGQIVANAVLVAAGTDGVISVFTSDETELILDVNGYFIPAPAGATGPIGPPGATGPQGPAGPAGAVGPTGATGLTGPIGAAGSPGLVYQGTWSAGTAYSQRDFVFYSGSSYVALAASSNQQPDTNPSSWALISQQGATGPAGPAGLPGAVGATGPSGSVGPIGLTGPTGPVGPTGAIGPAGTAGLVYQGTWSLSTAYALHDVVFYSGSSYVATAANTAQQPDTSPSFWSLVAQQGNQGPAGPTGAAGANGSTGSVGPTGPAGAQGIQGVQGNSGPVGLTWQGTWSSATTYSKNDAVSYQGSSYISLQNSNINHTPPASPTFWSVLAVQGAPGDAGATGPTGPTGPTGVTGPQGLQGPVGQQGLQGPAGLTWRSAWSNSTTYALNDAVSFNGSSYISLQAGNVNNPPDASPSFWSALSAEGATGSAGPAGPTGPTGSTGGTGPTGPTGPQGPQGSQGVQGPVGQQGLQGPAGLTWRSAWSSSTTYALNDAVSFNGSSYISLQAGNLNHQPDTSSSFWSLLAQQGAPAANPAIVFSGAFTNVTSAFALGYIPAVGVFNGVSSTEADVQVLAGTVCAAQSITVSADTSAIGIVRLRINAVDSNVSCFINGGTCSASGFSVPIVATDLLSYLVSLPSLNGSRLRVAVACQP